MTSSSQNIYEYVHVCSFVYASMFTVDSRCRSFLLMLADFSCVGFSLFIDGRTLLSYVGCRASVVDCRGQLSLTILTVGAQL